MARTARCCGTITINKRQFIVIDDCIPSGTHASGFWGTACAWLAIAPNHDHIKHSVYLARSVLSVHAILCHLIGYKLVFTVCLAPLI